MHWALWVLLGSPLVVYVAAYLLLDYAYRAGLRALAEGRWEDAQTDLAIAKCSCKPWHHLTAKAAAGHDTAGDRLADATLRCLAQKR